MRGQMFTLDLFAAYGVFMLIMLFILALSSWVAIGMVQRESTDSMMREAMTAADYLTYNGVYTTRPYELNNSSINAFFGQTSEAIADELQLSRNFSIKIIQLNSGQVRKSAGAEGTKPTMAVSLERRVIYSNQPAKLVVMLWRA